MITTSHPFNLKLTDCSWHNHLVSALTQMSYEYLNRLQIETGWLPGPSNIFNAFSLPFKSTRYVLFGESPYPRANSANGYAFWDAAVDNLWDDKGLSKSVNRATSFRNLIKMLLVADGKLSPNKITQTDIAKLNKTKLVKTNSELFENFLNSGFLLLNATPIFRPEFIRPDAKAWQPFIQELLKIIVKNNPDTQLILLGNFAKMLKPLTRGLNCIMAEHPYNISFISNKKILNFFRPLSLLTSAPVTL